jgi:hypothetical protein
LSINNHNFDNYNEDSDQDWDGQSNSDQGSDQGSDTSSIDQSLLSHPVFHLDEDDVDVDGFEDESQYQQGKYNLLTIISSY